VRIYHDPDGLKRLLMVHLNQVSLLNYKMQPLNLQTLSMVRRYFYLLNHKALLNKVLLNHKVQTVNLRDTRTVIGWWIHQAQLKVAVLHRPHLISKRGKDQ